MNGKIGMVIGIALLLIATVFIVVGGMVTDGDNLAYEEPNETTSLRPEVPDRVEAQEQFINAVDLDEALEQHPEAVLIDVRNPEELEEGYIEGSHNVPLPQLFPEELPNQIEGLEKDDKIYVYCRSGGRSERAMERLIEAGYTDVTSVDGGYSTYARHHNK